MLVGLALLGWSLVGAAGLWLLRMLREESRADRVIGLLYHRVVEPERYKSFTGTERIFSIPVDRFEEQLEWLLAEGYRLISLDALVAGLAGECALEPRSVFVSFDDGCESVATHARPVLERLGVPAVVFVTTDEKAWIFSEGEYFERRMTLDEMRDCIASGITIGSHAITHRGLNEMSRDEALAELSGSRASLAAWLDVDVDHFAVPLNFYDAATLELCREAGYRSVSTSDNGTSNRDTSPYRIKRFIVEGGYDAAAFARSLTPRVIVQRRLISALKKLPPRILGERIWMPLRERIFASVLGRWLGFRFLRLGLIAGTGFALGALIAITGLALLG